MDWEQQQERRTGTTAFSAEMTSDKGPRRPVFHTSLFTVPFCLFTTQRPLVPSFRAHHGNSFQLAFRITGFLVPFSCVHLLCWFARIPPTPPLFADLHVPFCPDSTLPPLVCPPHRYPTAFSTDPPLKCLPPPRGLCSSFLTSTYTFSHPNAHTFSN